MHDQIRSVETELKVRLEGIASLAELMNLKSHFLGKEGEISRLLRALKELPPEERKSVGAALNQLKGLAEESIATRLRALEQQTAEAQLSKEYIDLSLRASILDNGLVGGGVHPLTTILRELEDVFLSMGFEVLDGPHIEDDYHNFGALNIPSDHPARDMQDTFWFPDQQHVLRTQTSCIQVRGMEQRRPPFRFVGPGSVFRCERTDASHEMTFFQFEGMLVDRGISLANLIYFAQQLYSSLFNAKVAIRTRPSYFPFVEPGLEIDMGCLLCNQRGCAVCKHSGWVELLGAGLVHPQVLINGKIDPAEFSGFAFGLGVDRLLMMRYAIDDIRHLRSGDLRFVSQFRQF